ncbi:DUF3514 domain-containing protein [Ehrlichia chaffeensis]|uniref:DUF3514 domain-containing protein n=1 Tax=Ehrlichia chaffeensis TaxID=945 RepID=UPI0022A88F17|nr:DUF3514 domain-containing protein [Ehrlichia chaffeensis]
MLLSNFLYMYSINDDGVICVDSIPLPRITLERCDENFAARVQQSIVDNSMNFSVLIGDLASRVVHQYNMSSVAACEEAIEAYCALYDEVICSVKKIKLEGYKLNCYSIF